MLTRGAKQALTIVVVVVVVSLLFLITQNPRLILFQLFSVGEFTQEIAPLLLIALFIERTVEVMITPWRAGESKIRQLAVDAAKSQKQAVEATQKHLAEWRSDTQKIAFAMGMSLGVLLAAVGLRALEIFVDAAIFDQLPSVQQVTFGALDVLVTGAVLGGGADGLHKLVSVFTNFLETTATKYKPTAVP
jgi:hypothetical protein